MTRIAAIPLVFAGLLLRMAASAPGEGAPASARFDLVVRHARVVDGNGGPWYRADVGIREGRIAAIGSLDASESLRVVEADRTPRTSSRTESRPS